MNSIEVKLIARMPSSEQYIGEIAATHRSLHIIAVRCSATGTLSSPADIIACGLSSPTGSMVTVGARKLDIGADQGGSSIDTGVRADTGMGEACVT